MLLHLKVWSPYVSDGSKLRSFAMRGSLPVCPQLQTIGLFDGPRWREASAFSHAAHVARCLLADATDAAPSGRVWNSALAAFLTGPFAMLCHPD